MDHVDTAIFGGLIFIGGVFLGFFLMTLVPFVTLEPSHLELIEIACAEDNPFVKMDVYNSSYSIICQDGREISFAR